MTRPLAIDLYCGLGGWTEGLLAEGFDVIGFDIKRHEYGEHRYPAQLVIQDVLTLHGSQFREAALIVASPPCQFFSYVAMPWKRAKALAAEVRADPAQLEKELALFKACFRIREEAGVPMVIENVRGAIPWIGRSRWNFGSYHLWGDVPGLMPHPHKAPAVAEGFKSAGMNWSDRSKRGQDFTRIAGQQALAGIKGRDEDGYERNHPHPFGWKSPRTSSGNLSARKAASAMIAKIPLPLSRHIAAVYRPRNWRG